MLLLGFEVNNNKSIGLYHDAVDIIFESKNIPMGFNVLDFQGRLANRDFELIRVLLKCLPNTSLLI